MIKPENICLTVEHEPDYNRFVVEASLVLRGVFFVDQNHPNLSDALAQAGQEARRNLACRLYDDIVSSLGDIQRCLDAAGKKVPFEDFVDLHEKLNTLRGLCVSFGILTKSDQEKLCVAVSQSGMNTDEGESPESSVLV